MSSGWQLMHQRILEALRWVAPIVADSSAVTETSCQQRQAFQEALRKTEHSVPDGQVATGGRQCREAQLRHTWSHTEPKGWSCLRMASVRSPFCIISRA